MKLSVSVLSSVFIFILSFHVHKMRQVLCLYTINYNDKRISILYKMSQQFFFALVLCALYTVYPLIRAQKTVNKTWLYNYVVTVSVRL